MVRSNGDYYNAMIRHGWLLPTISSSLVTREYMDGVRTKQYYCPHIEDEIPKLLVANPPPKLELLKIWKKAVYQKVRTDPANDQKWNSMLAVI